jgi:hypothetical protein
MPLTQLILEYLKVFLSTQVVAGIIAAVFLAIFRDDIKALFRRIAKIRLPDGAELSTPQSAKLEEAPEKSAPPALPSSDQPKLPPGLDQQESKEVRELLDAERATSYLWEYRYLNYFLVPYTQRVLDWLASLQGRTNTHLYDTVWLPLIPDPKERQAILDALGMHHLISIDKDLIQVTPKGREYIQWRGPLPEPPKT